jgi:branched-chain amino acid transport system substrate-binding protein
MYYTKPTPETTTTPKIEVIKIGLIEPLTGAHAVFGQEAKDAAELMIDIINNELGGVQSLGGAKLQLVVEDAGESPDQAKLAAEKLVSEHHPPIIVGAYISRLTAAVAEITEREGIILMMDGLVDELTQKGWKYVFRAAPRASAHGRSAVEFVLAMAQEKGLEIHKVAVIHEDSIFGTYVAQGAIMALMENGIYYTAETYPYDISDATPLVSKLMEYNPDVVISVPYFHDGVLIAKAIQAMGFKPMFIAGAGACGYTDPDSIEAAGAAVEYYTNTYSYNPARPTEWNQKVVNEFQQRYGYLPTEAAGIIFYSIMTIYEALEKAGQMFPEDPLNPDNLREAFLALDLTDDNSIAAQLYPTGHIKFAPNGDNIYAGTAILQVIGGEPKVVWPDPEPGVTPVFPRPDWSGAG